MSKLYTVQTGQTIQAQDVNQLVGYLNTGPDYDITAYGAVGDCRWITDAAISSGSAAMTSPVQAQFTQADVGKRVDINGAVAPGTTGAVFTATIQSVQSLTACTLSTTASVSVSSASANIGTDNQSAIQAAINAQQTNGGRVRVPRDSAGGKYLCDPGLTWAPGSRTGGFTTAIRPLVIQGDGENSSFIVAGGPNTFSGLFGDGATNVIQAQVITSDLCLDGNYLGAGGVLPQPTSQSSGLVFTTWPYTNAFASPVQNGQYHVFSRTRFYRPAGFTFQPTRGVMLSNCTFDQVGQPDVATAGLHWDNLGSGAGDAIVTNCTWTNSAGNYADFVVNGTGLIRLIMIGCVSYNHKIGGIYAFGDGSLIAMNRLSNVNTGSSIGYDSSTAGAAKVGKNVAAFNVLTNLNAGGGAGAPSEALSDKVMFNGSPDSFSSEVLIGALNLSALAGNFNANAIESSGSNQGDKIALYAGAGPGNRFALGTQSGAMVVALPNVAGQKLSVRLDPGGTSQATSGNEVAYLEG